MPNRSIPNLLQQQFTELKSKENLEKVAGQETDLVLGIVKGQPPVKFYFDKSSGLLLRMVHYTNTPLGLNPTQVDFADYRSVDGVKTPYPVDDCAAQRSIHHSDR